jgi:hypothetical protein
MASKIGCIRRAFAYVYNLTGSILSLLTHISGYFGQGFLPRSPGHPSED